MSVLPSLPSTPGKVPSGHETKSSILYLHSPIVRLSGDPLIQGSLNYLSAFSGPIDSWAHLQHSVTYGPLVSFSACGPNLTRRYNRPICGPLIRWAVFIASSNTAD